MQVKTCKGAAKPKALPPAKGADKTSKAQHAKQQIPAKRAVKTAELSRPAALELNSSQNAYEDLETKIVLSQQLIEKYQKDLQLSKMRLQGSQQAQDAPSDKANDDDEKLSTTMVHQGQDGDESKLCSLEVQKLNSRLDDLESKVDMILELFEKQSELQAQTTTRMDDELTRLRRFTVQRAAKSRLFNKGLRNAMQEFADYSMDIFKSIDEKFAELESTTSKETISALAAQAAQKSMHRSKVQQQDASFFIITNTHSKQIIELREQIEALKAKQFNEETLAALANFQTEIQAVQKQTSEQSSKHSVLGTLSEQMQDQLMTLQKNFQEFVDKYNADISFVGQKLHDLEK